MKAIARVLLSISFLIANAATAAQVAGTWKMSIEMQGGTSTSTFVLTQNGDAIAGTYKGQFGEASVTGSTNGNDVVLVYRAEAQGVPIEVTYTGTVDGTTMSGKVSIAGFGDGTFKGSRQ